MENYCENTLRDTFPQFQDFDISNFLNYSITFN